MIRPLACLAGLALLVGCTDDAPINQPAAANETATANAAAPAPVPDAARVRIETGAGAITLELDGRRAPVTTANFLAYADQGRFDGTSFYRAAPTRGAPGRGFIQGGIRRSYRRMLPPIAHEPTSKTGLRHEPGTISMARTAPGNAMGEFFITTARMEQMDARGDDPGYAAFGRVVEGMDVIRRILDAETIPNAGSGSMRGQMLADPVAIVRVRRVE
ncbi:peptidylprolyl isomerase [Sphingosinicella sp. LHD-64]|uniref:peptidylprolyl isomerase n=1 Tax=Sphingosinicella sp. LHD-64 TaxID=3072139 RepID=UPI00280CB9C8|nr:peptidylprolyl isomerase [Sphingosinicella sp. LHD-64]MDQ8756076.1 peptidylprolyl isomerase [Sphingosinicella sp. LHD-64]